MGGTLGEEREEVEEEGVGDGEGEKEGRGRRGWKEKLMGTGN